LYAELDKLSAAWEALDRQVKNKVFDLIGMEDRLTKSGLDVCFSFNCSLATQPYCIQRAKSENKFYAAMRDKEAIEAERKNIARNLEKQAKVVERLVESERSLTGQVVSITQIITDRRS
jgi:E3 ubiquitin-protein ligase BRE1